MGLRNWPIFRAGLFRQAKYLVSTPQKSQNALEILETGVVGIEPLPMQTGFLRAPSKEVKKAWANIHTLKAQIYKNGQPTGELAALPISERSYIPLDPQDMLKQKDKEKLASLDDIALSRHDDAMGNTTPDSQLTIQRAIVNAGFIFLFFLGLIVMVRGC